MAQSRFATPNRFAPLAFRDLYARCVRTIVRTDMDYVTMGSCPECEVMMDGFDEARRPECYGATFGPRLIEWCMKKDKLHTVHEEQGFTEYDTPGDELWTDIAACMLEFLVSPLNDYEREYLRDFVRDVLVSFLKIRVHAYYHETLSQEVHWVSVKGKRIAVDYVIRFTFPAFG